VTSGRASSRNCSRALKNFARSTWSRQSLRNDGVRVVKGFCMHVFPYKRSKLNCSSVQ